MSGLEIFQNGTSLHADTMGEPVYQIGTKNADGGYDAVVSDGMTEKEAKARLEELQPAKAAPKPAPAPKKSAPKKKVAAREAVPEKKVAAKKKAPKKKAVPRKHRRARNAN